MERYTKRQEKRGVAAAAAAAAAAARGAKADQTKIKRSHVNVLPKILLTFVYKGLPSRFTQQKERNKPRVGKQEAQR